VSSSLRLTTLFLGLTLALALVPTRALAWTEARIESAHATVEVEESGAAEVELELLVHVHRGWLTSLRLAGFDPGLALSEDERPSLRPADAEQPARFPEVRVGDDGSLAMNFPDRDGPRRGDYRLRLRYRTPLPADADAAANVHFTLPGFEAGLDGVELVFRAPLGTRLASDSLPEATTQVELSEANGKSVLSLRRAHVPRTVPWTVELVLPNAGAAVVHDTTTSADAPNASSSSARRAPWALALVLVVLGPWRRRRFAKRASELGMKSVALLPFMPPLARDACVLVGALGYARALPEEPVAALVFLSFAVLAQLERVPTQLRPARPGAFVPATYADRAKARRARLLRPLRIDAWLDATEPTGLLALALVVSGLSWLAASEAPARLLISSVPFASLWLVPTFLSGHARALPATMDARLSWADGVASRLEGSPHGLHVLLHRATDGRVQDARVDVELARPETGLLRLQILMAPSPGLSVSHGRPAALLLTRAQSPADFAASRAFPDTSVWTSGDKTARLLPLEGDLGAGLSLLAAALSRTTTVESAGARPARAA